MSTPWADEIRRTSVSCNEAIRLLRELERWAWDNIVASDVWPHEMPEPVGTLFAGLHARLQEVRAASDAAFQRYSSEPSALALMGREMTREQYFLAQAMIAAATEGNEGGTDRTATESDEE
jgi:hypothetical protein